MTAINGIGNTGAPAGITPKGKVRADSAPDSKLAAGGDTSGDRLDLSDVTSQVKEAAGFDSGKVEQIKASIRNGNYPLDAKAIAQGFTELEQLLGNRGSGA
jgi:negative regulator of flagellin synthesis FlgM